MKNRLESLSVYVRLPAVITCDLAGSHRYQRTLVGSYRQDELDEGRVVFALHVELGRGVLLAQVVRQYRHIGEVDVTFIAPRVHGDAMRAGVQTQGGGLQQVGHIASTGVSEQGVLVDVYGKQRARHVASA